MFIDFYQGSDCYFYQIFYMENCSLLGYEVYNLKIFEVLNEYGYILFVLFKEL